MKAKRIIVGILIGVVISGVLECINAFLVFLVPPFLVFLPLGILIGGFVGVVIKPKIDSNLSDKVFENLPANAVEFIKLVIKKMRYRRKS